MSEVTPSTRAVSHLRAMLVAAVFLWLLVLAVQWRLAALPAAAPLAIATLLLLLLGAALLRQERREGALIERLRLEADRRDAVESALRQTRNMAAVGRLTRGLAHDFNNHLTAVNSNIELLARRLPDDEGARRLTDAAIQGVRRAALLTHTLLSLSRKPSIEAEPLDVGRLVGGMAELLRRILGETVVVETALGHGPWLAWADASQVEWALLDLALNARDAMPDGGQLKIETAQVAGEAAADRLPSAGDWVMLVVSDTGHGSPLAEDRWAETSVAGAQVRITHAPNQGSTVRLYLPRHVMPPAAQEAVAATADAAAPGGTGTVLVVEDDGGVRRTTAAALRALGYRVLEAPDAMEGFRLITDRGGIDLLLTDIGLPGGVDGRALADAARNVMPELKVLFATGYAATASAGGVATAEDGTPILLKPFSLDRLAAQVRQAMPEPAPDLEPMIGEN